MGFLEYYFLIINFLGFILVICNLIFNEGYSDVNKKMGIIQGIVCILGGSLGALISILIFDRKAGKYNAMFRVFFFCVLIIQIIALVMLTSEKEGTITFNFIKYFKENTWLLTYLLIINMVTFIAFCIDKLNAIRETSRIRVITLLTLAFVGGSIGAITAMYTIRHKTKKNYFYIGVPMIIVTQIIFLFYLINS